MTATNSARHARPPADALVIRLAMEDQARTHSAPGPGFCATLRMAYTIVLGAALGVAITQGVVAQEYPQRSIRVIVPFPPGGQPDVLARTIAQPLSDSLGQSVVIDNRPGGGGAVAADLVKRAAPDGYTVLIADSSLYAVLPTLNPAINLDPLRDFEPVSLAAMSPIFLTVNGDLPVRSVSELLALARSKPGLPFGSSGSGTSHHLALELLKSLAGVDFIHVPYKGAGQAVPAVVAGDVVAVFAGIASIAQHEKTGKLRVLAIAASTRSGQRPDIPTIAEAGVAGYGVDIALGYFAPAKTPREIVDRLSRDIVRAVNAPQTRVRLAVLGVDSNGTSPDEFADLIRKQNRQYGELIRATGIHAD